MFLFVALHTSCKAYQIALIIANYKSQNEKAPAITARAIYLKAIKSRSGDLLPPSPPTEKSTERQDQTRKAGASDWTGDGNCHFAKDVLPVVNIKYCDFRMIPINTHPD